MSISCVVAHHVYSEFPRTEETVDGPGCEHAHRKLSLHSQVLRGSLQGGRYNEFMFALNAEFFKREVIYETRLR